MMMAPMLLFGIDLNQTLFCCCVGWCRIASAGRVSGDAEHAVFYEKCMSIIVIIITPNGDWNYGYTPTTHNTNPKVQNKQKI